MGYCTVNDMRRILPEKIQIGDSNIGTPVPGRIGNQGSTRSNITPQDAERYISYAQEYIDDLAKLVTPGGVMILSGILQEQATEVEVEAGSHGLRLLERYVIGDWVGLAMRRPNSLKDQ